MTVHVDNMRRYAWLDRGSGRPVTGRWSHLLAETPAELAVFAAGLGLRPEWLQLPSTAREHYDIVETVRRRAIAKGAIPISYPSGTANLIVTKRLHASALDAANRGWQVFPLRPGTKTPAVRDWEHQASGDPERIRAWWSVRLQRDRRHVREPFNVGVACGPSGLVVIDLDVAKPNHDRAAWPDRWRNRDIASGADVLAALADQAGQTVPGTYAVATALGGRHLYFTAPDGVPVRNSAGRAGPLIDVRGHGGYVVAVGSRIRIGPRGDGTAAESAVRGYRLLDGRPPVELPGWLTAELATDRRRDDKQLEEPDRIESSRVQAVDGCREVYGAAALRGEVDRVGSAPVGRRNHTLNAAAYSLGQLIAAGILDRERTVEALGAAADSVGLEPAEIAATIESGLTAGARRPRLVASRQSTENIVQRKFATAECRSAGQVKEPSRAADGRRFGDDERDAAHHAARPADSAEAVL